MREEIISDRLGKLYRSAPSFKLNDDDRIVIFSDLHMGNGSRSDDFQKNATLFKTSMKEYYLKNDFKLILNGDIEELHKFMVKNIVSKWNKIYAMFRDREDSSSLHKIRGNHDDYRWTVGQKTPLKSRSGSSIRLRYNGDEIFIFHGHQASLKTEKFERMTHYVLRYLAAPMGIHNVTISRHSTRKFLIENRAYDFARKKKIMAIIGHTHRPLFESLSKIDTIKFRVEQLIKDYPSGTGEEKAAIEYKLARYKTELDYYLKVKRKEGSRDSLYKEGLVVPCLFNSGCAIGKSGMTAIEIHDGAISLVHWFNKNRSSKYFDYNGYRPEKVGSDGTYRVSLKKEDLKYIFSRINLLS